MSGFVDDAVVLKGHRYGEADRIVVFLSAEHGKVRAVAKGSRKTTSRVGARLEPLTHVRVQFLGNRDLAVVGQVDLLESPAAMSEDLDRLTDALTILEVVDLLAHDREPAPRLYAMLVGVMRVMAAEHPPAVLGAFILRALASEGLGVEVRRCVSCGGEEDLRYIDVGGGGTKCANCRGGIAVDDAVLEMMRDALGDGLRRVLSAASSATTGTLNRLAIDLAEHHLERRLRVAGTFAAPELGRS